MRKEKERVNGAVPVRVFELESRSQFQTAIWTSFYTARNTKIKNFKRSDGSFRLTFYVGRSYYDFGKRISKAIS